MRRWWIVAGLAALGIAGGAAAQEAAPDVVATVLAGQDAPAGPADEVEYRGYVWGLDPAQAAEVCVLERAETQQRATVLVFVFANVAGTGWVAGIPYEADATGALAAARPGECRAPNAEADNGA